MFETTWMTVNIYKYKCIYTHICMFALSVLGHMFKCHLRLVSASNTSHWAHLRLSYKEMHTHAKSNQQAAIKKFSEVNSL